MNDSDPEGVIIWPELEPSPAARPRSRRGVRVTSAAAVALDWLWAGEQ